MDVINECPKGRAFKLSEENEEFWELFQRAMPGLITQGGFDYTALKTVFDVYALPVYRQIYYLDKAVCLLAVIREIRKESHG